jgi:hypothetical protein
MPDTNSFAAYARQWWRAAFAPAWDFFGWFGAVVGGLLWAAHKYAPQQFTAFSGALGVTPEAAMSDLVWQVPLAAGAIVLAYRLVRAPYEIHVEMLGQHRKAMHERQQDIQRLQKALEDCQKPKDTDAAIWRTHEVRFESAKGTVYAIWNYFTESGDISWEIRRNDGATERDRQAFEAEAIAAADDLKKHANFPQAQRFSMPSGASAVDIWLNALAALVDPKSDWTTEGSFEGRRRVGGTVEDLGEASVVACKRLSASDTQPSKRFMETRCFNATKLVSDLDAEINAAVDAGYDERQRQSVEAMMQHIGDWLSLHFGPHQRSLFFSAPPYPQTYSSVPDQYMAEWQVAVGRQMYLRELATKWCDGA